MEYCYLEAKAHFFAHGNFNYINLINRKLFLWILHMKEEYKKGLVSEERYKELKSIGINLSKRSAGGYDDAAERMHILDMFREEYQEQFPNKYKEYCDERYNSLAQWLSRQRTAYRGGQLSDEVVDLLENYGVKLSDAAKLHQLNGGISRKNSSFDLNIELLRKVVDSLAPDKNINFQDTLKNEDIKKAYRFIDHCRLKARQGVLAKEESEAIFKLDFSVNQVDIKETLKHGDLN